MISAIVGNTDSQPNWAPLEEALSREGCVNWMYMGGRRLACGVVVHAYKHADTRSYVNLSDDGRAWLYEGERGYREISRGSALGHALASGGGVSQ